MKSKHRDNVRLAIVAPTKPLGSETFINAHLEFLKPNYFFYGGSVPLRLNDQSIQPFWLRGIRRMIGQYLNRPNWHDLVAFRNKLRKEKINIILAEYGVVGAEIANICKNLNIKLIVHFHGFDATRKVDSSKYLSMFKIANKVIAVSRDMKEDLMGLGCDEDKIVLNPYGPNQAFEKIKPVYESQNLIALGRFVNKKAPYYLILAFEKISRTFPDASLTIIGDGPLLEVCFNLINHLKLNNRIKLVGSMNRDEIIELFENSSVFVQHSVESRDGDKEGSPVAIMEAALAALPIVSTRHAGIKETVIDNLTGFLVDEHDVDTFAEKLELLLGSSEMCKEMGMCGRKHIQEHFSMSDHILNLERVIHEAFNE